MSVVDDGARQTGEGAEVVDEAREAFLAWARASAPPSRCRRPPSRPRPRTQEISASASKLAQTAEDLSELVSRFRMAA